MFQLQVADTDVTNGTIGISWCIDKSLLQDMVTRGIEDPQVVICVAPVKNYDRSKEYRKVVPLKDLMTFVEFHSAGENKIWGYVSYKSPKDVRDHNLARFDRRYASDFLNTEGDNYSWMFRDIEGDQAMETGKYVRLSTPVSVLVPKEVFAQDPPAWETAWVNHFFMDKLVDQCHYRRRRLFAYLLQPFIMFFNILLRLILTTLSSLLLLRAFTLKYLFHPLTYPLNEAVNVMDFSQGSLVIRPFKSKDKDWWTRHEIVPPASFWIQTFWAVPLVPLISIPVAITLYLHLPMFTEVVACVYLLLMSLMMIVSVFGRRTVAKSLMKAWDYLGDLLDKPVKWLGKILLGIGEPVWYLDSKESDLIVCAEDRKPITYKALPAHHKSIRLRFQNLKSKVCKPFSR